MNISYSWLREYVDFDLTPQQVADALTSIGLEVDALSEVQAIKGGLQGLVVGEVLTCEPHPNSDHMHVCSVALGQGEPQQIVCGAPNVAAGQKVIVATLGTKLYQTRPDGTEEEFTIKRSKLRGVESLGMICAEDEIGVGQSHDGIIVLPASARVGQSAAEYYGLQSEWVIEVDITPNRADACSHYGVARDLYAYLRRQGLPTSLRRPSVEDFRVDSHELEIPIRVEAKEACPRYCGVTLTGCQVKESPEWLQKRLTSIGLRPINNIVDITNYIMMAYGQPLHCFDADMIEGHEVVVRTMEEGTKFTTLDGVEHTLSCRDLAICNQREPMCIAGVFGGRGSGTYEGTSNVLLESAYFNPTWIRKSARRHGLQTDASFRFERGVDPDGQIYALKRAAMLCQQLAGGRVSMEIRDVAQPSLPKAFAVELNYDYMDRLVGKRIERPLVRTILEALEMKITGETAEGLSLLVPAYRVDVQRPCDVVEDVLRIYGYNNVEIPTQLQSSLTQKGEADRSARLQELISQQLIGAGLSEILNNSLTREAYYTQSESHPAERLVRLLNPLSSDLGVMRQTLLFGGLESIARNANRQRASLALFEFGNCYYFNAQSRRCAPDDLTNQRERSHYTLSPYSEDAHLGLWLTGRRVEGSWAHTDEETNVYQLKGHVWNVLERLGVDLHAVVQTQGDDDLFARSLRLQDRQGAELATLGLVRPAVARLCGVEQEVCFADLNWTRLMRHTRRATTTFSELSKYPAVTRDLALLVDRSTEFAQIERLCRASGGKLLKSVRLFDVYEGDHLPEGKKSYAVKLTLQDPTRTLQDKQTDAVVSKIVASLRKQLGAELR